jgi:hypothetical protein
LGNWKTGLWEKATITIGRGYNNNVGEATKFDKRQTFARIRPQNGFEEQAKNKSVINPDPIRYKSNLSLCQNYKFITISPIFYFIFKQFFDFGFDCLVLLS